jgi:hypothetical protein
MVSVIRLYRRPSTDACEHGCQDQTGDELAPRNVDGSAGNAGETQHAGDNGDIQNVAAHPGMEAFL